jgi:hypothetical protein
MITQELQQLQHGLLTTSLLRFELWNNCRLMYQLAGDLIKTGASSRNCVASSDPNVWLPRNSVLPFVFFFCLSVIVLL